MMGCSIYFSGIKIGIAWGFSVKNQGYFRKGVSIRVAKPKLSKVYIFSFCLKLLLNQRKVVLEVENFQTSVFFRYIVLHFSMSITILFIPKYLSNRFNHKYIKHISETTVYFLIYYYPFYPEVPFKEI